MCTIIFFLTLVHINFIDRISYSSVSTSFFSFNNLIIQIIIFVIFNYLKGRILKLLNFYTLKEEL